MIATSFKDAIIEMMGEIAKQIPDSHKQTSVKAYLTDCIGMMIDKKVKE